VTAAANLVFTLQQAHYSRHGGGRELGSFDPTPDNPMQGIFQAAQFVPFTPDLQRDRPAGDVGPASVGRAMADAVGRDRE